MKAVSYIIVGLLTLVLWVPTALAEDVTWIGGVSDKASDKRNWSTGKVPLGNNNNLIFDGTSGNATIDINLVVGNLDLCSNYTGKITITTTLTAEDVLISGGTLDIGGPTNAMSIRGELVVDGGKLVANRGTIIFSGPRNGTFVSTSSDRPVVSLLFISKSDGATLTVSNDLMVAGQLMATTGGVVVPDPSSPPTVYATGHVSISQKFEPILKMVGGLNVRLSTDPSAVTGDVIVSRGEGTLTLDTPLTGSAKNQKFIVESGNLSLKGNSITLKGDKSLIDLKRGSLQVKGCEELKAAEVRIGRVKAQVVGSKESSFFDDAAGLKRFLDNSCKTPPNPPTCSIFTKQVKGSTSYHLSWNVREALKAKLAKTKNGKTEILSSDDAGLLEVSGGATYILEGEGPGGKCKKESLLAAIKIDPPPPPPGPATPPVSQPKAPEAVKPSDEKKVLREAPKPVPEPIVTISARIRPPGVNQVMVERPFALIGEGRSTRTSVNPSTSVRTTENVDVSYLWEVVRGTAQLEDARSSQTRITPQSEGRSYELEIRLTVTNANGLSQSDRLTLTAIHPVIKKIEERVVGFDSRLGRVIAKEKSLSLKNGAIRFLGLRPGAGFTFSRKGYFGAVSDDGSLLISNEPTQDGTFDLVEDRTTKFHERRPRRQDDPFLAVISGDLQGDKIVSRSKGFLSIIDPETKVEMAALTGIPANKEVQIGSFTVNGRSPNLFFSPHGTSGTLTSGQAPLTTNLQSSDYPILGMTYQQANQGNSQVTPQIAVDIPDAQSVAFSDLNGDHQSDLIVAATNALYIFYGGSTLNLQTDSNNILLLTANKADVILNGIVANGFGQNMVVVNNPNNSNGSQIVISAPQDNNGAGAVYVIPASALSPGVVAIDSAPGVIVVRGEKGEGLGAGGITIDGNGQILTTTSNGPAGTNGVVEISLPLPTHTALAAPKTPEGLQTVDSTASVYGGGCGLQR